VNIIKRAYFYTTAEDAVRLRMIGKSRAWRRAELLVLSSLLLVISAGNLLVIGLKSMNLVGNVPTLTTARRSLLLLLLSIGCFYLGIHRQDTDS
jgi:hypothetical protein